LQEMADELRLAKGFRAACPKSGKRSCDVAELQARSEIFTPQPREQEPRIKTISCTYRINRLDGEWRYDNLLMPAAGEGAARTAFHRHHRHSLCERRNRFVEIT
jgi:hypothetical protein